MKNKNIITMVLLLTAIWFTGTGCHLVLPLSAQAVDETKDTYHCSAQIYRSLPGGTEFTEEWECSIWPLRWDSNQGKWVSVNPDVYATEKINEYISESLAPGFTWHYRNLTTVLTSRKPAVDCLQPATPHTFGAPLGAEIRWNYPPANEASVSIWLTDKYGVVRTANPSLANAYMDFAERTGLPDWEPGGVYQRLKRHIRFEDMFLELDTPFALGPDMTVTELYIQSIGTVYAEHTGGLSYRMYPGSAKFFIYGQGVKSGETGITSFCFWNESSQNFAVTQGLAYSSFALGLTLTNDDLGQDMLITISLSKPAQLYPSFSTHQPVVNMLDKEVTTVPVTLTPEILGDMDNDLQKVLWFENFETAGEIYLGQGNPLPNVMLTHGDHEITAVAYDSKGSYDSDTMTLTVNLAPPNDSCSNAIPISDGSYQGSTVHASRDGVASCGSSNSSPDVWYMYVPDCPGLVSVDLCGSDFDTVLSVFTFCPQGTGYRFEVACNDDCGDGDCNGTYQSCLTFYASPGESYWIRIAGYNGATGAYNLNVHLVPPINDNCTDALPISNGTTLFSTCLATTDGPNASPNCNFSGYTHIESDIWFRYHPACSGNATVSLCDSSYDTKLAVYGRFCPTQETEAIACNDDYCGLQSQVTFPVTPRGQYLLRIGGYRGAQGAGSLTIYANPADLNLDCDVNLLDFAQLADPWQNGGCRTPGWCDSADINHDGVVNMLDLMILVENWLEP
ncbi:MAG: hypothetical protein BWY71_01120 [Planctomycetes bacterium ADurb.Bin412]|nr:MAG: hypothetical protein BWY71_01120 [Planctomycetes bacterium ADurb.Bin412]